MFVRTQPQPQHLFSHLVRFSRALHDSGVPVNSANLIDLCASFRYIDISRRDDFYAAARATLICNYNDLQRFDEVFAQFWEHPDPIPIRGRAEDGVDAKAEADRRTTTIELPHIATDKPSDKRDKKRSELAYSPDEVLMTKDLGCMSDREIERARYLIKELVATIANYWSRRYVATKRGRELDFRRILRRGAVYGTEGIAELTYRSRRIKKVKLVLLCDVSGSMERYSSFLIQFIYALRQEIPDVEVAVFSTRMTMISEFLKTQSVEDSLKQVAASVHDWAGGTNIGACMREFNDCFARDMLHSRSVVVVMSDGWDRGDAYLMRKEVEHLRRRAYKLLWLNPLLGNPGYRPLCRGMRTALPYLDYFLPAHDLESLAQLAKTLRVMWR